MSLSPDLRTQYVEIIDSILARSDLTTVSRKDVRDRLQEAVGYDLTPQKAAIKPLIIERFNIFAARDGTDEQDGTPAETANGTVTENSFAPFAQPETFSPQKGSVIHDEPSDESKKSSPNKKRKSNNDVDADALFAAKLQAEENMRARPTRAASSRRAVPPKQKARTKTAKKVKAEDDSEMESGTEETTKRAVKRSGGFHKPLNLSPALSALLGGEVSLSRPETVKRIWQYIREHDLQDPSDRRQIRCDDAMRAVFKQDRIHMFTMNKALNQNLYNPDE